MIRECLGNKGIEKVFRFVPLYLRFLQVVQQSYETKITMGCVRTILLLIEAKALRSGRNKNNIKMCNRSSLIMNNFRNYGTVVTLKAICFPAWTKGLNDGPRDHILHAIQSGSPIISILNTSSAPSTHLCTRSPFR